MGRGPIVLIAAGAATRRLLLAAVALPLACTGSTDPQPLVGTAAVTIDTPAGTRSVEGAGAAFHLSPSTAGASFRTMTLGLGTRPGPGSFALQLSQFLGDSQEAPAVGTFATRDFTSSSDPAMSAYVSSWDDAGIRVFRPAAGGSVTIETATAERVTGSFVIPLRNFDGVSDAVVMTVHGTFEAGRVARYQDLPSYR